jgi:hypothetical protein
MPEQIPGWRVGASRHIDHITSTRRIALVACAACVSIALIWMLFAVSGAQAAACASEDNYTGATNGAWNAAGNWSKGLPKSTETVCIPEAKGTIVIPALFKAEAKVLLAQSGLSIEEEATLAISEKVAMEEPKVNEEHASRFTDLTVGGTLSTAGAWIMMSGNVLVEGEITSVGNSVVRSEDVARLLSGTLSGNGTIDIQFSDIAGTIEPGGAGVIGELHFTSLSSEQAKGTLVLDIKSASEFDQMADLTSNFFFDEESTIKINLLGGYEPAVGTKWEFMSKGPGDPLETSNIEPSSFTARSVSGGAEVERISAPPTVVTTAASSVLTSSAQLNGTVNPNGVHVSVCEFKYGLTSAYEASMPCSSYTSEGKIAGAARATITGLTAGTTYHFKILATSLGGTREGLDETFKTPNTSSEPPLKEKASEEPPAEEKISTETHVEEKPPTGTSGPGTTPLVSSLPGPPMQPTTTTVAVATAPKAVEELLLGCGKRSLVLNDVLIRGGRVALDGSATKSLVGKKVEIVFDGGKPVATATVQANGEFSTTAPLPPAKLRDSNSARYLAESDGQRSLNLKLTRRVSLEAPSFSGGTVTLSGQVVAPLGKPISPVTVEQQLECGKTSKVMTFTPEASGRFHVTIPGVPANAKAGIYRLSTSVLKSPGSHHLFATFSLPLPVVL